MDIKIKSVYKILPKSICHLEAGKISITKDPKKQTNEAS